LGAIADELTSINPRYLAEDTDRRAIVGGLKLLRRLFAAPSLAKYIVAEKVPGPGVQTDDELLDYARQNGSTVYHASCSCTMGSHAMSVVDDQLRVHGLEALRVIDASIMPAVSSSSRKPRPSPAGVFLSRKAALCRRHARPYSSSAFMLGYASATASRAPIVSAAS
jgi:GMC oxidoreductase